MDCPLPRRPWCSHCINNTHSIEYFPDLISKWEDRARKRGANLINSESRPIVEGRTPNIKIVTIGGTKNSVDIANPHHVEIQKAIFENTKYEPIMQKEFFKDTVEMFRKLSSSAVPEVAERSFKPNPHQPRVVGESLSQMEPLGTSHKALDLWLQLFSNILDDEQLSGKLQNKIKMALGTKGNLE